MPRENEQDVASAGKQSPEPANESSQSPEPVSDVSQIASFSSDNKESSLDPSVEEDSSNSTRSAGDSLSDSVCPICGGKKVRTGNLELEPELNSDEDIDPLPESNDDGDLKALSKSSSGGNLAPSTESSSVGDVEHSKKPHLVCKCGLGQDKTVGVEKSASPENDAGVEETARTEVENPPLAVQEKSPEQEFGGVSVEVNKSQQETDAGVEKLEGLSMVEQKESSIEKSSDHQLSGKENTGILENNAGIQETENTAAENQSLEDKSLNQVQELSVEEHTTQQVKEARVRDSENTVAENLPLAAQEDYSNGKTVDEGETLEEKDAEVGSVENQSLILQEKSSSEESPKRELSGDSMEETSCSASSDSPSENFAIITCVRPRPRSSAVVSMQRRRPGSRLDEVSIPLQERPLLGAAVGDIEEGRPPSRGESPQVELESQSRGRNNAESRRSISSLEYKSMLRVIGCIIALVFTVLVILLVAAQLSFNRTHGLDTNPRKDLDRNSTAEEE